MYTMQYFSAIRKQEMMASPATGSRVEMIIPSEVRETEREVLYDIPSRCNLKMDTNEVLSQRNIA